MTDFIKGKSSPNPSKGGESLQLFNEANVVSELDTLATPTAFETQSELPPKPLQFSPEATAVFDAGRELWRYYHQCISASSPLGRAGEGNVNASFYDIRAHFQGRNDKGRMNARSNDVNYTLIISELRNQLNALADKIKPKIYEYEFLKE